MIKRTLDLSDQKYSYFLFGPRQTGKTRLIQDSIQADFFLNLLKSNEYLLYSQHPERLRNELEVLFRPSNRVKKIVIDEIQRVPQLLNEVHLLIEEREDFQFILTGSSSRKLRAKGVNLLGGRALVFRLFPFTHEELGDLFHLEQSLRFGTLPKIYLESSSSQKIRLLKTYVEIYLQEEIQQEANLRNVPAFARFLELAAHENGNLLNYNNLSREVGVNANTIKEYFQILEDTYLGFRLDAFSKSHRSKHVSHPKFYFFDCGIVSALQKRLESELVTGTSLFGNIFEHWVILETFRLLSYREREYSASFFRTSDGAEVDLILEKGGKRWAIEIKSQKEVPMKELKGLRSFISDHPYDRVICVCQTPRPYVKEGIEFLPWKNFFEEI